MGPTEPDSGALAGFGCLDLPTDLKSIGPESELIGWCFAGAGHECRDIRARVDGRVFFGVYGLERLDVQRLFPAEPAARFTGFLIRVKVWRGARELVLEFMDELNGWRPFVRRALSTDHLPPGKPPRPLLRAARVYDSLRQLYILGHRERWREVRRLADAIVAEITTSATEVSSETIFRGYIENPGFWISARYDKFRVTGWTFSPMAAVRSLTAITGGISENRLVYGKPRPDVAPWFPGVPAAAASGFYGLVDLRTDVPSPACLRIFAHLEDGSKQLVFARRLHLSRRDEHSGPIPVYHRRAFGLCLAAFGRAIVRGRVAVDDWRAVWKEAMRLGRALSAELPHATPMRRVAAPPMRPPAEAYVRWVQHNRLTARLTSALQADAGTLEVVGGPCIGIIVTTAALPGRSVRGLLEAVRAQLYPSWQLFLAAGPATAERTLELIASAAEQDPRIKLVAVDRGTSEAEALNAAAAACAAPFLAIVWRDLRLSPDALLQLATALHAAPDASVAYGDEDRIDAAGRRFDPQFKGAWSPERALVAPIADSLVVVRRELFEKVKGLRSVFDGAHARDLLLRIAEMATPDSFVPVPHVCCHVVAAKSSRHPAAGKDALRRGLVRRAVAEALQRRGLRAELRADGPDLVDPFAPLQLQWDRTLLSENPVTIVIPTRNQGELLARCLASLARTTPRESVAVIVVDDASDDPATLDFLAKLPARPDLRCTVVSAPAVPHGFDYSRLVNLGSARATTPFLLHLNNDVEALEPGWLEDLVGWATVPGVGVVGARLLYPDGSVNHAGISLSREDDLPHALFDRCRPGQCGGGDLVHTARNVMAVTGACLLTPTALYRRLGGFDEIQFKVAYNDVDYCRRAAALGQRTVYSPGATLCHVGSASRGTRYSEHEHIAYIAHYPGREDPWLSRALAFPPAALAVDPYQHCYATQERPFRALIVTHNLKFEGAPLFILEYARFLAARPGVQVGIVSPEDGPLRAFFEEAGMPVAVVDATAVFRAPDERQGREAIARLAGEAVWAEADVVVCNSMAAFWAVAVARALQKPSLFYIHESMEVRRFVNLLQIPRLEQIAQEALTEATRVVFIAEASRQVHEVWNRRDNFRSLKSWVDIDRIEQFCARHSKDELRRKHGLAPDAVVVVNIGSVCERKGQHVFVRAISQFNGRQPAPAGVEFLMVGGRPGLYRESLEQDIELLQLRNVRIVEETPDVFDFFRLADLFVCTSFEESFPRVLLEAMAFRLPIVSTDVNGIPEMLVNNDEALLIPAGDPFKLVGALERALAALRAGDTRMTSMAYAHVSRSFRHDRSLPRHLEVTREALLG